ncbi:MAG: glycogen debranching protein GlgX [Treponemataceae bacterium]|nr:glycogen debranching protein GlgX [Treponemataceae bacterium]
MNDITVQDGNPLTYGATLTPDGVNFCIFSRNAKSVMLCLFDSENASAPYYTYTFDENRNHTGDLWHVCLKGVSAGTLYLYRMDGEFCPEKGLRFDRNCWLIDPYAKALTNQSLFANLPAHAASPQDRMDVIMGSLPDASKLPKCVVIDDDFDWEGDRPLNYRLRNTIIYETHLKGFTASATSGVEHPGTYRGMMEKIPYLKELGVTSVELLPVQEFDAFENTNTNPRTGERLVNFWGYSTMAFFAPKATYASDSAPGAAVREFKEMVKAMHRNGLEVILDIVFNHTAEGNEHGITFSFRGIDNPIYYILEHDKKEYYANFTGCGNTVNCNHPVVRDFIVNCLRYWVCQMHVDGFRFDLAPVLGRGQNGALLEWPPLLERIAEDPVLSHTKIIAEAWDAAGAYLVGNFPGGRWAEWNDRFRDDMRRFWRGDENLCASVATRLTGSADLYLSNGRKPYHSINFLTSHDGFTLNDLLTYNGKHNEENGEHNRDGNDTNWSCSYGYEGLTENPEIENMRTRQAKNMMFSLLLAQGTPMLLAGDELRRTQGGNNNAYCQDNGISWVDWTRKETHAENYDFTRKLIAFRKAHPAFMRPEFFTGKDVSLNTLPDITWFDESGNSPNWGNLGHFVAFRLDGSPAGTMADSHDNDFYIMINADDKDKTVWLPEAPHGKKWYRAIDTTLASPQDFAEAGQEELLSEQTMYILPAKGCALLLSKAAKPVNL